jgi:hypothetical protein
LTNIKQAAAGGVFERSGSLQLPGGDAVSARWCPAHDVQNSIPPGRHISFGVSVQHAQADFLV